jgi:putative PIN family toxin of toxin-antitoxin system
MASHPRIVLDTNVFVSALLALESTPGLAVQSAILHGILVASDATILELSEVLQRRKFARLASGESVKLFRFNYQKAIHLVEIVSHICVCRDPRDDKFLEVAIDGHADVIVTGDADLLSLDPFQGIRILTPQEFLATYGTPGESNVR